MQKQKGIYCFFKMILQKQLLKMPKDYIIKQIFNEKHKDVLCLVNGVIIGGLCYRTSYEQEHVMNKIL